MSIASATSAGANIYGPNGRADVQFERFIHRREHVPLDNIIPTQYGPTSFIRKQDLNARDDYAVIDTRARVYFRDVYDHLVRLHDITESIRDLVSGTLDTYLSVINNRMNDIMKTLTIITTMFMPISFVAGFFGMNFFQPVAASLLGWADVPVFAITLAITLLTPIGMFWWVHSRGWM